MFIEHGAYVTDDIIDAAPTEDIKDYLFNSKINIKFG